MTMSRSIARAITIAAVLVACKARDPSGEPSGERSRESSPAPGSQAASFDQRAAEHLLAACDGGDGANCLALDRMLEQRDGLHGAAYRAAAKLRQSYSSERLYRLACKAGHGEGCYLQARSNPSRFKASLYEEGCAARHAPSCTEAALEYETRAAASSRQKALPLFVRGCELGDAAACAGACRLDPPACPPDHR